MNLTSAARVNAYFGTTATAVYSAMLAELIPRASKAVINFCNRPFDRVTHTLDKLNGSGSNTQRLPDYPVISVSAVQLWNNVVPASADGLAYGYQYDDKYLYLFGDVFPQGLRNVLVSYISGFTGSETDFIPATPGPYTVTPVDLGYANTDRGVVYTATGVALTLVGSAPSVGQYSFSEGVYTFAAADQGVQVTMSFDYVPGDVEQACIELIGTVLQQRTSLGITSKSLRDESISFEKKGMPQSVTDKLWNYKKVVPV